MCRLYTDVISTIGDCGEVLWQDIVAQIDSMNECVLTIQNPRLCQEVASTLGAQEDHWFIFWSATFSHNFATQSITFLVGTLFQFFSDTKHWTAISCMATIYCMNADLCIVDDNQSLFFSTLLKPCLLLIDQYRSVEIL